MYRFIALVILWWCCAEANDFSLSENSRLLRQGKNLPLVFPDGGTFKLLLGWGIPVKNPLNVNLVFAFNIQYQYPVPPNITFFQQYYPYVNIASRRRRSQDEVNKNAVTYEQDKYMFYNTMEKAFDRFGVNGRECLLRTICEAAEMPVEHDGYVGELMHLLLTPNYNVTLNTMLDEGKYGDYGAARLAGEQMFDCRSLYPKCPDGHGLFDMISIIE